jgi:hypothetical protein
MSLTRPLLLLPLLALACASEGAAGTPDAGELSVPEGCLTFEGHVLDPDDPPGERAYAIDAIRNSCVEPREVVCAVGTWQRTTGDVHPGVTGIWQPALLDLDQPRILAPFEDAQFHESNGEMGYRCADVTPTEADVIRACLDEVDCAALDDALGRTQPAWDYLGATLELTL